MRTVIDEAIVALNLEDHLSEPMAAAVARARAEAEELGHIKAKIKVDAETAKARADLAEMKASVKDLSSEEKKAHSDQIKRMEEDLRARQRVSSVSGLISRQANDLLKQKTNLEKEATAAARNTAKAEDESRTAALRRARDTEKAIETQGRYIRSQEKLAALRKAESRAQGSEKIRVQVDSARALAEMTRLREELNLLGAKPIDIKVNVDEGGVGRVRGAINSFTGAGRTNQIRDLAKDTEGLGHALQTTKVNIGAFSTSIKGLLLALSTLAPIVTGLVGTLGALISVAGAGIGGALGVGSAALTGFGLAAIGVATSVKPVITSLTQAHQATTTYNAAIAKYGENSKQGEKATKAYQQQLKSLPPLTRQIVTGFGDLRKEWLKATQATAQHDIGDIVGAGFKTVQADMGFFARDTNRAFNAIDHGWSDLMKNLRDPTGGGGALSNIFGNFDKALPNILRGLNSLVDVWLRVTSSFSDSLPGLTRGFAAWAKSIDQSAINSDGFQNGAQQMVHSLRDIGHLAEQAGRFLIDFFKAGVQPGESMVEKLTGSLSKLNDRLETTSGQTRLTDFYTRSISLTSDLFKAVGPLASAFVSWSQAMQPIAAVALRIVAAVSKVVAVVARVPILSDVLGGALAIAFIGRMSSALFEMGTVAAGVGTKLTKAFGIFRAGGGGLSNIGPALKEAFTGGGNSILAAHEKGATTVGESILAAHTRGAAIIRGAEVTGGAEAGAEIATAERAGAVSGGLVRGGAAAEGGGLAARAGRAGVVGLGGVLVSQGLGGIVGGKTGSAISGIGSSAAAGAALGSFFSPAGTFAGAVVGGLVGAFATFANHDADKFGRDISNRITAPMAGDVKKRFSDVLARDANALNPANRPQAPPPRAPRVLRVPTPRGGFQTSVAGSQVLSPEQQRQEIEKQRKFGRDSADAFIADFSRARLKSEPAFLADVRRTLSDPRLKQQGRLAGAAQALQYAAGLERNKELPKNATRDMLRTLEKEMPGLTRYMRQQGLDSSRALGNAMNFRLAEGKLEDTVTNLKASLHDYRLSAKTTGDNVSSQTRIEMQDLKSIMQHGTADQVRVAKRAYDQLVQNTKDSLNAEVGVVTNKQRAVRDAIDTETKKGRNASQAHLNGLAADAQKNMSNFEKHVEAAVRNGVITSDQGSQLIHTALNKTLKSFGASVVPPIGLLAQLPGPGGQHAATNAAASGRLMQIGRHGEAGHDSVPMRVAGQDIVVAPGEQVAVVNRHQQQYLNSRLADVGGFSGMFNKINRPNYMAGGGVVVGGRVSTFGPPGEPAGITATGVSDALPGISLRIPGTHYSDPRNEALKNHLFHVVIQGHSANLRDIDIGPNESTGRSIDVTGAGARAMGFNPSQFPTDAFGTATLIGPAGRLTGGIGAGATAQFVEIKAPRIRGNTTIARMVRALVGKEAKAANDYERKHMPAPVTGGGGGAGPVPPPPSGPLPYAVQKALFAARTLAARNEPYVTGGFGWNAPGLDCSGYVSTVMNYANLMSGYLITGPLKHWGLPGDGKWITVGVRGADSGPDGHTMMAIDGKYFESSGHHPGGGPHVDSGWSEDFPIRRHPPGLAHGGLAGPHPQLTREDFARLEMGDSSVLLSYNPDLAKDQKFNRWAKRGKRVKNAGAFAQGGIFTTNGPTVGLFGENGPETVMAVPHFASGTSNTKKPQKTTFPNQYLTGPYAGEFLPVVDPNTGRIRGNPYRNIPGVKHHHEAIHPLRPRDRIGGIGTEDLDNAVNAAHVALNAYSTKLRGMKDTVNEPTTSTTTHTDKHGHKTTTVHHGHRRKSVAHKETKAEKKHLDMLKRKLQSYQSLDDSAHARVDSFANLESAIGNVGEYLGVAGSHPSDTAAGLEPLMHKDRHGNTTVSIGNTPVTKTWKEWKKILDQLTTEHVKELRVAADEVRKKVGKWKDATSIQYVSQIQAAYGQALVDQQGEADELDPNAPVVPTDATATSVDDYIQIKGLTDKFALDNYLASVAQGNNVPDLPGTPGREDLASLTDDLAAAQTLMNDYASVFQAAQSDPGVNRNYPLMTSISDAFNSARQNYQSIQDQFTQAQAITGPTNEQLAGTALTSLFSQFGGNAANVVLGGTTTQALTRGMAAGGILDTQGAVQAAPSPTIISAPAQPTSGHTVNNYFSHPPPDAHTWSKHMLWELNI